MKAIRKTLPCIAAIALSATSGFTQADAPPPTGEAGAGTAGESSIGVRQQRVKRLMLDLERKFTELASKLEAEQPDQAKKLTEAFQRSKELLMQQRMDMAQASPPSR